MADDLFHRRQIALAFGNPIGAHKHRNRAWIEIAVETVGILHMHAMGRRQNPLIQYHRATTELRIRVHRAA